MMNRFTQIITSNIKKNAFLLLFTLLLFNPFSAQAQWTPDSATITHTFNDSKRSQFSLAMAKPIAWTIDQPTVGGTSTLTLFSMNTYGGWNVGYDYNFDWNMGEGIDVGADGWSKPELITRAHMNIGAAAWLDLTGPGVTIDLWKTNPIKIDLLALMGVSSGISTRINIPSGGPALFDLPFVADKTNYTSLDFTTGIYQADYSKTTYIDLSKKFPIGVTGRLGIARGLNGHLDFALSSINYFTGSAPNITQIGSQTHANTGVDLSASAGSNVIVNKRDYVINVKPTIGAGVALYSEFGIWGWDIKMFYPLEGSTPPDLISAKISTSFDLTGIPLPLSKTYAIPASQGTAVAKKPTAPTGNTYYSTSPYSFKSVKVTTNASSGTVSGYIAASNGTVIAGTVSFDIAGKNYASNVTYDGTGYFFSMTFTLPALKQPATLLFNSLSGSTVTDNFTAPAPSGGGSVIPPTITLGHTLTFVEALAPVIGKEVQIQGYVLDDLGNYPNGTVTFTLAGKNYTLSLINGGGNKGSSFIRLLPQPYNDELITIIVKSNRGLIGKTQLLIPGTSGVSVGSALLSITIPTSGNRWLAGTTHNVDWASTGVNPTHIYRIDLYRGDGTLVPGQGKNVGANKRSWPISFSSSLTPGLYKFRIYDKSSSAIDAWSSKFLITDINDKPIIQNRSVVGFSGQAVADTVTAHDPNDDVLSYSISKQSTKGIASLTTSGAFTYTPNAGAVGADSFVVSVSDGIASSLATISVIIIDSANTPLFKEIKKFQAANQDMVVANGKIYSANYSWTSSKVDVWDMAGKVLGSIAFNDKFAQALAISNIDVDSRYLAIISDEGSALLSLYDVNTLQLKWSHRLTNTSRPSDIAIGSNYIYISYMRGYAEQIESFSLASGSGGGLYAGSGSAQSLAGKYLTYGQSIFSIDYFQQSSSLRSDFLYSGTGHRTLDSWAAINGNQGQAAYSAEIGFPSDVWSVFAKQGSFYGGTNNGVVARLSAQPLNNEIWRQSPHIGRVNSIYATSSEVYTVGDDGKLMILNDSDGTVKQAIPNAHGGVAIKRVGYAGGKVVTLDANGLVKVWARNFVPIPTANPIITWSNQAQSMQVHVTDLDVTDIQTFSIQAQPASGSASIDTNGLLTYTPKKNYVGADSIVVAVYDGKGTGSVSIPVTVKNQSPAVHFGVQGGAVQANVALVGSPFNVMGYAVDPEGSPITSYAWKIQTAPTGSSALLTFSNIQNTAFTPDIMGVYTLALTASDGVSVSDPVSIDISAINNFSPQPTIIMPPTVSANNGITGYMLANDKNVLDMFTYAVVTKPAHGTLTVNAVGNLTYIPTAKYIGSDMFSVNVSDNWGASNLATATLNVVNNAPNAINDSLSTLMNTTAITNDVLLNDTDVNGDSLVLTAADSVSKKGGKITNNHNGTFTYVPVNGFVGPDSFTYTISDSNGGVAKATVQITVNSSAIPNQKPIPTAPLIIVNQGKIGTSQVSPNDPNGADTHTYAVTTQPKAGNTATISNTGLATYTPAIGSKGSDFFIVTVTDQGKLKGTVRINVTVNAAAGLPGTLQFSKSAYSVVENVATGVAKILVSRVGGSAGVVSVNYVSSNGTAIAGSDYTAVNNTLTWADGDVADKVISIPIINDTLVEPNETVNITLSNPSVAILGAQKTAVLTIIDDDKKQHTAIFSDLFNGTTVNKANWNVMSGTWSAANGQLTGFWSQSAAQTDQGDLLLAPSVLAQGADFSAQYKFKAVPPSNVGHRFSLYNSVGNLYQIAIGATSFSVQLRKNAAFYTSVVANTTYVSKGVNVDCSQQVCTASLDKVGNNYTIKLNGSTIGAFADTVWNGNTRLGLGVGVYGTAQYDSFSLNSIATGGGTIHIYNLDNNLTPPDMTLTTVLANVGFTGGKLVANTIDSQGYLETKYSVSGSRQIRAKAKASLAYSYWGMSIGIAFVDKYGNQILSDYVGTSVLPNKLTHFFTSGATKGVWEGSFTLSGVGDYFIELEANSNQAVANVYDSYNQLLTTLTPAYLTGKSFADIDKIRFIVYATTENNAMIDDLLVDTVPIASTRGLVGYYPFDGNANDASSNGRNGTAIGNPVYVAGVHGQALSFDGVNDEVSLGTWALPSSGSVALWINQYGVKNNPSSWVQGVFGKWSGTSGCSQYPFTLSLSDATKYIGGSVNPACAAVSVKTGTLMANQWYHITFTWSAAAVNMFVDGILVNSAAGKLSTSGSEPVTVGRWHNALNGWGWYAGKIDDLRIYNRVLSAAEIQTLAGIPMTAITAQHALQSGWNLIGWSVEDTSYSTPANFAQLVAAHGGQVRSIWNYVGGNSNLWQNWNGLSIAASDPNFTALIAGKGYWVEMAPMAPGASVMITLKGVPAPSTSTLQPGWSVVTGSPNIRDVTALSGLVTQWGVSSAWSMQYGVWQSFIAGAPTFLNSMQSMSSEQGYYIFK